MTQKKNFQSVILVATGLIAGFILGLFVNFPQTGNENVAGTIGEVDRYRNVKVTKNDIRLRNELVDNVDKRRNYLSYLQYFYYNAMRTSHDIDKVLGLLSENPEFEKEHPSSVTTLKAYQDYLKEGRADILNGMRMLSDLNKDKKVAVIDQLNKANDAISRIKSNKNILSGFTEDLKAFIRANPQNNTDKLKNAHDILATNLFQNALFTKDRPMLAYLKEDGLLNDKAGLKALCDAEQFQSFMQDKMKMDAEKIGLLVILNDQEKLASSDLSDAEKLGLFDAEKLGNIAVWDTQKLGAFTSYDTERLNMIGSAEAFRAFIFDAEKLGLKGSNEFLSGGGPGGFLDAEKLGAKFLDAERLGVFDSEKLGMFFDSEKLGFADSEKLEYW